MQSFLLSCQSNVCLLTSCHIARAIHAPKPLRAKVQGMQWYSLLLTFSLSLYSEPDWIFLQIYPFPWCILFSNLSYFVPTILQSLWKLVPVILGAFPEKLMLFISSLIGDYICYFSLDTNNHICHCNLLLLNLLYQPFLLLVPPIYLL